MKCWFHKRTHCTHCIVITRHHNRASSLRQTVISSRRRLKWAEIYATLVNTWAGSQVYAIHVLSNLQAAISCNIEIACSLFCWIFGEKIQGNKWNKCVFKLLVHLFKSNNVIQLWKVAINASIHYMWALILQNSSSKHCIVFQFVTNVVRCLAWHGNKHIQLQILWLWYFDTR